MKVETQKLLDKASRARRNQHSTVLGNERFREQIEAALKRRLTRLNHGGDRRSEAFRTTKKLDDERETRFQQL